VGRSLDGAIKVSLAGSSFQRDDEFRPISGATFQIPIECRELFGDPAPYLKVLMSF
jgi:hypothetical protein